MRHSLQGQYARRVAGVSISPESPCRGLQTEIIVVTEDIADFGAVRRMLEGLNASWEPAEAHGAFCGRACLAGVGALTAWVDDLARDADPHNALAPEHRAGLQRFAADTLLKLEAGQMQFNLLLPDDDVPVELRVSGLADWCHGFMHGLAAAGGADQGPGADALEAGVVGEILEDFSEITRAAADDAGGNDVEQAFAELEEYVRVSVQLVYEETADLRPSVNGGQEAH